MSSVQNLCSVINNKYSDNDIKLTIFYLANKKQNEFIDMLYYILEEDTPLFFELFGGQTLKIPSKFEFSRTNRDVKVFLYLSERSNLEDPFKLASYKFNLYIDRLASIYINCYECFIKNKSLSNIDIDIKEKDLFELENLYNRSLKIYNEIKENPELNKRYTYTRRKHALISNDQYKDECVDEINYNDLLGVETDSSNNIYDLDSLEEDEQLEYQNKEDEKDVDNENENDNDKQLSLFS